MRRVCSSGGRVGVWNLSWKMSHRSQNCKKGILKNIIFELEHHQEVSPMDCSEKVLGQSTRLTDPQSKNSWMGTNRFGASCFVALVLSTRPKANFFKVTEERTITLAQLNMSVNRLVPLNSTHWFLGRYPQSCLNSFSLKSPNNLSTFFTWNWAEFLAYNFGERRRWS